jgi:hypothetical protein
MNRTRHLASAVLFAAALTAPSLLLHADLKVDEKGFARLQSGEERWEEYPGVPGINRMIVYGDPSKPGAYVIRVKFSPGIMSMPHFHPEDRLATVIKGTWWTGTGENSIQRTRADRSRRIDAAPGWGSAFCRREGRRCHPATGGRRTERHYVLSAGSWTHRQIQITANHKDSIRTHRRGRGGRGGKPSRNPLMGALWCV